MVEIIFHIGMGKTGTSSIQAALNLNQSSLRSQMSAEYLGLWFDLISEHYKGFNGQAEFLRTPPEEMPKLSEKFSRHIERKVEESNYKLSKFILSNEAIYGYPENFSSFINTISQDFETKVIIYARDPIDWLPSAYTQWGIVHKAFPGEIVDFNKYATRQIKSYAAINRWKEFLGNKLQVREYKKSTDIVKDFAEFCGIILEKDTPRILRRIDNAEISMRAAFNRQFHDSVLPGEFDKAFSRSDGHKNFSLNNFLKQSLDYSSANKIVNEHHEIFQAIKRETGVDFTESEFVTQAPPSLPDLRNDVVDLLVDLVAAQAKLLQTVRNEVAELRREMAGFKNDPSCYIDLDSAANE